MIDIELKSSTPITLKTANTYSPHDIRVTSVDDSVQSAENQEYLKQILNKTVTDINLPNATHVWTSFQESNTYLTRALLPKVKILDDKSFSGCRKLATVDFSGVEEIRAGALSQSLVTEFWFPSCTKITGWGYTFHFNLRVKSAYFPKLESNTSSGTDFAGCTQLSTLVLGGKTVISLGNANVFGSASDTGGQTPIFKGTGYIYVRKALVDSYKAATYWSTFANQIRAIEDYTDIYNRVKDYMVA